MKIKGNEQHVVGSQGLQETKAFKIKTTAAAFKLLSSGLYADKVSAVLREIACNAVDAHIAAGIPHRPIEVKLPNAIDTQFYVKDWGPGLSHDDVMNLYTSYFESSKQNTNEQTGAFGLGSKSPFSYTDSFFVTSAHGGKKRTYSAHLDNTGAPTIALLTTEDADADWQTGLLVGHPVKPSDFQEFQSKAKQIYRWFRTPPNIVGSMPVARLEYMYEDAGFVRVSPSDIYPTQFGVLMGNVMYPLQPNRIQGLTSLGSYVTYLPGIIIKANIGDVAVTAGREDLQYDVDTCKYLVSACEDIVRHVANDVAKHIDSMDNDDWEQRCGRREIEKTWGSAGLIFPWEKMFTALGDKKRAGLVSEVLNRSVELPPLTGNAKVFARIMTPVTTRAGVKKVEHMLVQNGKTPSGHTPHISYNADFVVYHGHDTHALRRVRDHIVAEKVPAAIMFSPNLVNGGTGSDAIKMASSFMQYFKMKKAKKISDLPKPVIVKGAKKASTKLTATSPLPSTPVKLIKDSSLRTVSTPMNQVPKEMLSYMVGHRYDNWYRIYDKNVDDDKGFDSYRWSKIWETYSAIARELKEPAPGFVLLTAAQAKSFAMKDRKIPDTFSVIVDTLNSKAWRDKMERQLAKWSPTINLVHANTLSTLCRALLDPNIEPKLQPVLKQNGLYDELMDLATRSKDAGDTADFTVPRLAQMIDGMRAIVPSVVPLAKVGTRSYMTPDDFQKKLESRFPRLVDLGDEAIDNVFTNAPARLPALLEFALK